MLMAGLADFSVSSPFVWSRPPLKMPVIRLWYSGQLWPRSFWSNRNFFGRFPSKDPSLSWSYQIRSTISEANSNRLKRQDAFGSIQCKQESPCPTAPMRCQSCCSFFYHTQQSLNDQLPNAGYETGLRCSRPHLLSYKTILDFTFSAS